jgi:hypothetical protein
MHAGPRQILETSTGDGEPAVPRPVQVAAGLLLLPFLLLSLAGSALLVISPPGKNTIPAMVVGSLMVLVIVWAASKLVRLVCGRRARGSLLEPIALCLFGVFLLLVPWAGVASRPDARWDTLAVIWALAYAWIGVALFRMARARSRTSAQPELPHDGSDSDEPMA